MERQGFTEGGSPDSALPGEDAAVPNIPAAFAVPAATSTASPAFGLAPGSTETPGTANGKKGADGSTGRRRKVKLLKGKRSRTGHSVADDAHSDSWTSSASEGCLYRATRSHTGDLEVTSAEDCGREDDEKTDRNAEPCNGARELGQKERLPQVCWRRCLANLKKTWWPRLNRGMRIGAITTLALHLSVSKSLPGIGGILGQDWCINTYSLASTVLPEQSGAVISGLWVWVFTLACIAVLTFLLFPVLGFGAALGRVLCLLLFLLVVSWLSVMRLPLIYKVPPFDTDVNTHSLTSFAYLYIPYTTASVILSQQYRAFDTDLKTGLQFVVRMNTGVLLSSLLGWALFLLQVVVPPWSSQRHIVRVKLSRIMGDLAAAVSDISESFVQLRRILLSKSLQVMQGTDLNHSLDDLRVASHALQRSCQPLYKAIGSQTQLRVSIVASSTEPYLMYPGPTVFLFPFFARCCEVLVHNCMNVITLARHIDTLARDPLPVRLDADAALANILLRTEPLLCTTVTAYQLCAELMLVRPDTLHRAAFKAKLRAGLEQLDYIDKRVSATFGLLRSPSMQEVSTRQLAAGDDVSVCLQRLLSRVSVGSNMGGSCPSEASAGFYPMSGVSATFDQADHSFLRTWSQTGDFLPVRYSQNAERSQLFSGAALEGLLIPEDAADRARTGSAPAPERQSHQRVRVFHFGGTPLSQQQRRETIPAAAAFPAGARAEVAAAAAEQEIPSGKKISVIRGPRRWLLSFGFLRRPTPTSPRTAGYTSATDAHVAGPARVAALSEKEIRTAAAAAGLEVPDAELPQASANAPSAVCLGLDMPGPSSPFISSNANSPATTSSGGAAAPTTGAGAAETTPVAATTESVKTTPVVTGRVAVGPTAGGGAVATRNRRGWEQGGGSSLKLELHPIAEEPEHHPTKPPLTNAGAERIETSARDPGVVIKELPILQQTVNTSQIAEDGHSSARNSGSASAREPHPEPDGCTRTRHASATPRAPGVQAEKTETSHATVAPVAGLQGTSAGVGRPSSAREYAEPSGPATAHPELSGDRFGAHSGDEQTVSTIFTSDGAVGANVIEAPTCRSTGEDSSFSLSSYDPSSSPAVSSSAPLSLPLHPTDSQSLSSHTDGLASSATDLVQSAPFLSPSAAPLPLPATTVTTSAARKFTRDPLPGVLPPFLRGDFSNRSRTRSSNNPSIPLLSADLDVSDSVPFRHLPPLLRPQQESTTPSVVSVTSPVAAVPPRTATNPSSSAGGATAHVAAAACNDASPAPCSAAAPNGQTTTSSSPAGRPSDAEDPVRRGPPAIASHPVSISTPVTPTAYEDALSSRQSSPSPRSSPPAQVPDLVPTSDDALFERLLSRSPLPAGFPAAADDLRSRRSSPTENRGSLREALVKCTNTPVRAGRQALAAGIPSGWESRERPKDITTAISSSTSPQTRKIFKGENHMARNDDAQFASNSSSAHLRVKSRNGSAGEKRGSPALRRSQHWKQEGELPHLRSLLTQEEQGSDSSGATPSPSRSVSPSTPSAKSSVSSIDMDAVLTNLLQQSEEGGPLTISSGGEEESADIDYRNFDAGGLPSAAAVPSVISAPLTPAAPVPPASSTSPPSVNAYDSGAETYLPAVPLASTPTAPFSAPAGPTGVANNVLPVNISLTHAPGNGADRVGVGAVAAPTAHTARAASILAGGPGAPADERSTMSQAVPESPAVVPVSENRQTVLSASHQPLTHLTPTGREDVDSSQATTVAAGLHPLEGDRVSLAQGEERMISPGAPVMTGDRIRSTQAARVPSTPTSAPLAAAHGGKVESSVPVPDFPAERKASEEKTSRAVLLETPGTICGNVVAAEEQRERATSGEETPMLANSTARAGASKQENGNLLWAQTPLRDKQPVCTRLKRKWKRRSAPWTWLATRGPWSLVSAQRRQRQREEDLQALRALRQPSRRIGSSTAQVGGAGGRRRPTGVPVDYSTTAELRQELRISKLVVSLYRICAMDTQELCSTVRGLCLAIVSPSWEGARQNLKMMMLSLAMIFIQLFFGLRKLVRVDKWKWGGSEAFYRDVEAVHCMKLIFGLGFLFCCCLFYGPQIDRLLGGPHIKGGPQTAKQWMILGFLCAHSFTYEGNTHKGIKRAVGTLLGGLAVELALMVTSNYVLLLFLMFLSIVFVVFIFASPTEPASEFDKEFGYIGQVFIWTVTFILDIIWMYEGLVPFPYLRDTVVRSRICGNLVGIGFSMLLIYVPPVFSAERAARTYCATLLKTCRRCILLMNAAFLSLTTGKDKPEKPPDIQMRDSTNDSTLASHSLLGLSPSPLTAINKPFHWARMWKFRRGRLGVRKARDWRWMHKDREPQKDPKKAFHYYLQQAEELLRHHSTRLLVVARMLYDEGASSEHSPVWRVDKDIGEIMNKVEYLVMSVVDAVDNLCQLAMGTDPDLAALLHGSAVLARESVLTLLQQDRRNWERVMCCRAGKALLINMVRMVKAQSTCSHLLAKEIQAAGLHVVDRIISWDWLRFPATMPPKYIRAVLRYIQGRKSVERYTNKIYESLAVCGRELREQGLFELDDWKGAIFSVLLIIEKCETRTYFMDEVHRFQLNSACRVVFGNEKPQLLRELLGSDSMLLNDKEKKGHEEARRHQRSPRARVALVEIPFGGNTRAHSFPLRETSREASGFSDLGVIAGEKREKHIRRRHSV